MTSYRSGQFDSYSRYFSARQVEYWDTITVAKVLKYSNIKIRLLKARLHWNWMEGELYATNFLLPNPFVSLLSQENYVIHNISSRTLCAVRPSTMPSLKRKLLKTCKTLSTHFSNYKKIFSKRFFAKQGVVRYHHFCKKIWNIETY